jgi:hypothetical protein
LTPSIYKAKQRQQQLYCSDVKPYTSATRKNIDFISLSSEQLILKNLPTKNKKNEKDYHNSILRRFIKFGGAIKLNYWIRL